MLCVVRILEIKMWPAASRHQHQPPPSSLSPFPLSAGTLEKVGIQHHSKLSERKIRAGPTSNHSQASPDHHNSTFPVNYASLFCYNCSFVGRTVRFQTGGLSAEGGKLFPGCQVWCHKKKRTRQKSDGGFLVWARKPVSRWIPVVFIAAVSFPNGLFFSLQLWLRQLQIWHSHILFDPPHPVDEFLGQWAENTSACVWMETYISHTSPH